MSLNLGVLVIHASLTALFLKIPFLLENLGFTQKISWQFYSLVLSISICCSLPMLYSLDKLSKKPFIYLKIFLLTTILMLICAESLIACFYYHKIAFIIALTLFFAAFNVLEAGLPSLITQFVKQDLRGTAMGVYSTLQFLGLFLGGVLGGLLGDYFELNGIIALCFILALIWFIICCIVF